MTTAKSCVLCAPNLIPVAEKAYQMFFDSNLGDSGLFPGSAQVEKEVMAQLAGLLNNADASGFMVSGGTEANLMALLAARNRAQIDEPEVILPESAHFSFNKICGMLKIKPIYVGLDSDFRVNVTQVEKNITKTRLQWWALQELLNSAASTQLMSSQKLH